MFKKITHYFRGFKTNKTYTPMPQTVIRNAEITSQLNENGYCIVDFLSATQLQSLRDVNEKFCKTKDAENFTGQLNAYFI